MITVIFERSKKTLDVAHYEVTSYKDKGTGKEVWKIFAKMPYHGEQAEVSNAQGKAIVEYREREVILGRYSSLEEALTAKAKLDDAQMNGLRIIKF